MSIFGQSTSVATAFTLAIILGMAVLRLVRPRVSTAIYVLAIPIFPFYWTPVSVVGLNDLSVLHILALGLTVGMILETWGWMASHTLRVRRLAVELAIALLILFW